MNDHLKNNPLTEKQEKLLVEIESYDSPVNLHDHAMKLGLRESAPLYGSVKALIRKGLLEKVESGRHATYQSLRK